MLKNLFSNLFIFLKGLNKQNFHKIFHALKNEDPKLVANNIRKYFRIRRENPVSKKAIQYFSVISKIPESQLENLDYITETLDKEKRIFIDIFFDQDYFLRNEILDENERISLQKLKKTDLYEICLSMNSAYFNPLFDLEYYNKEIGKEFKIQEALNHFFVNYKHNPNPLFDISFYKSRFLENNENQINPLIHYLLNVRKIKYLDPNPIFSSSYYLETYPDIGNSNMNPLSHYLEFGFKESRSPHPLFNVPFIKKRYVIPLKIDVLKDYLYRKEYKINKTCSYFDGEYFSQTNNINLDINQTPLEAYLKTEDYNKIPSNLFDPIKYSDEHLLSFDTHPLLYFVNNKSSGKTNFVHLSDKILDQWNSANKLESLINKPNKSLYHLPTYQLPALGSLDMLLIKPALQQIKFKPDIIVLISTMRRGGAELFNIKIINSILDNSDKKVLLIYTDNVKSKADEWLPTNPNFCHLDLFEIEKHAAEHLRLKLIKHLIESFEPEFVLNTNSKYGWDIYRDYGKSLSKITKLDACLFCYDYDKFQNKAGYPREYFRPCLPYLNKVITDNQEFIFELEQDFGLTKLQTEKLVVLNQPPDPSLIKINQNLLLEKLDKQHSIQKPIVLWASRMVKQKRPDILLKIASRLPQVDFHVWGKGNIHLFLDEDVKEIPSNMHLFGNYDNLSDINYANASLFLHTAAWDGVPTMLIDMLNIGFPVVAPDIGGIGVIVNDDTGWLIDHPENVDAYVSAIEEVFFNSKLVKQKLKNAKERLEFIHGQKTFNYDIQRKLNYYSND